MHNEGNFSAAESLLMGIFVVAAGMVIEPILILLGGLIIISALIASAVEDKKKAIDRNELLKFEADSTRTEEKTA